LLYDIQSIILNDFPIKSKTDCGVSIEELNYIISS